jgi:hypothetical protein
MLLHIRPTLANDSDVWVITANSLHDVIVVDCEGAAFAGLSDSDDVVDASGVMG